MTRLLLPFLLILTANAAFAGAWLREKGAGFSATTASITLARDFSEETFLEYGVRDDLTLGLELGFLHFANGLQAGSASLFLRRPIGTKEAEAKLAYELGLGVGWRGELVEPLIKAGLSWGRGYSLGRISGWASVDASITWTVYTNEPLVKLDSTLGMNFTDRISGMVQAFHARSLGVAATSIAPSVIIQPMRNQKNLRIRIGAETQVGNSMNTALKLGLWREF